MILPLRCPVKAGLYAVDDKVFRCLAGAIHNKARRHSETLQPPSKVW